MIRKVLFAMMCLLGSISAQAQNSPEAKARVAEIRKAYAEAKKNVATADQLAKAGNPPIGQR